MQFDALPSHVTIGKITREVDPSDWPQFRDAGEEELKASWNDYVAGAGDIAPRLLEMRMVIFSGPRPHV